MMSYQRTLYSQQKILPFNTLRTYDLIFRDNYCLVLLVNFLQTFMTLGDPSNTHTLLSFLILSLPEGHLTDFLFMIGKLDGLICP